MANEPNVTCDTVSVSNAKVTMLHNAETGNVL